MRIFAGILIAFVLWFTVFVLRPMNFWLMMSFATSLLILLSIIWGRPLLQWKELSFKNAALGVASAALLYGIFWAGNILLPYFIPNHAEDLNTIYANKGSLSPAFVALLLFFPIGFGEELFWRGFIQNKLALKCGKWAALFITTGVYAAVHIPTMNPVLILAALVCGAFWGSIYLLTGSIVPVLISHMLWDMSVFVLWPIK